MLITYQNEKKLFILTNNDITYLFFVNASGYLQHLYFGKHISSFDFDSFLNLGFEWGKTYLDKGGNEQEYQDYFYNDRSLMEIAMHGSHDKRGAPIIIEHNDGSTLTKFRYVSHRIYDGKPRLTLLPHTYLHNSSEAMTLEISLCDEKQNIELITSYTIFRELNVILRNNILVNNSSEKAILRRAYSYQLDLPESTFDLVHFCGDWSLERFFNRKAITNGRFSIESNNGRSGHEENPFVIICDKNCTENSGRAYAFSFVYSGNFTISANMDKWSSTRVLVGINDEDFAYDLKPNDSFEIPEGVMVYSENGFNGISHMMHDLIRNHLTRYLAANEYRPVLFNSWEGCYMDFNTQTIVDYINDAKAIGAELFVLDDGWFGKRNDDTRALGDWYVNRQKVDLQMVIDTSVMTSYNRINEEYVNESTYLLQDKLRKEYGFDGLIISDWCAVSNKWKGIKVGLDIEMPLTKMSNEYIDRGYKVDFDDEDLLARDAKVQHVLSRFKDVKKSINLDMNQMHAESVELANETLVLLKNNAGYFPLKTNEKVLVLGYFGNHSRFVGGGSGWVNAYQPQTFVDVLTTKKINYQFVQAYDEDKLLVAADDLAVYQKKFDKVILLLGQYQKDEVEGSDRNKLDLDDNQITLLKMVKQLFGQFGVVIVSGSVVNLEEVYNLSEAVLLTYLAGEGQAEAIYNNLFGIHNPCGRLPETWISSIYQNPIIKEYLRRDVYHTYYYDDIYVGYRYYDLHKNGFMLPFGYGLSYASFKYDNYEYTVNSDSIDVALDITNVSTIDGAEVIQIYVGKKDSKIYRPIKELKGFKKVRIKKGEQVRVKISLDIDDLKAYRSSTDQFELENGSYEIYIALNSENILDSYKIDLVGVVFETETLPVLKQKVVPNKYTVDSPAGLLFFNKNFQDYVTNQSLPINLENFEDNYWYLDTKTLRGLINDHIFNITFEELEGLINYLNSKSTNINQSVNFDEHVGKFVEITKW